MASAGTRSKPGPGLNRGPNPRPKSETKPWQPLEKGPGKERLPQKTLEMGSRVTSGLHPQLTHIWQPCLESRLSRGKTKGPNLGLRLGLQQERRPRTHQQHWQQHPTNFRSIGQKHGLDICEELKAKPGPILLPTNQETSVLVLTPQYETSPHCYQELNRKIPEPVESEDGSKSNLKLSRSLEVDLKFVAKPGLHFSSTFEQELDQPAPALQEPKSRTLRFHTLCKPCLSSHLQPFLSLLLLFFLASFVNLTHAGPPRPARPPLLSGQPYIVFWGIKDSSCTNRPDFRSFGIEPEGRVAVFYEDTLGNYPYFIDKDNAVNGGLPQHTKLDLHIQKTQGDVETALPAPRYLGLGVVRWQEWAPQWSRRGGKQGLYQNATKKQLRRFFPDWTKQELERWSKVDFEAAAQSVITETLREVQRSRPKALWGMCPYPTCSNSSPAQTALSNYTGECPEEERSLNDQLLWLWRRSNAIYPLLTLEKIQGGTGGAALFLSNQIREALRVASLGGSSDDLPVFPLVRSVYTSTNTFLSLSDLVTTIGESAALGTAGIVIWDKTEPQTEKECEDLRLFTSSVLGPYVSNVTAASRLCSASLCQNRGRCVRLEQDQPTYLHLPSNSPDSADRPFHSSVC